MIRLVRNSGLDDRFMVFVVATMASSVALGACGAAVAMLMAGNAEAAGGTIIMALIGGGAVFGPMLLIGFLPSLLAFAVVWPLTGGEARRPLSAEYARLATAVVASVFWVALLTFLNGEGAETVVGIVGVAAMLISPRVARWAYQDPLPSAHPVRTE